MLNGFLLNSLNIQMFKIFKYFKKQNGKRNQVVVILGNFLIGDTFQLKPPDCFVGLIPT